MKVFLRILAIVIVAVLLAGGWYFYSQYKTAQASQTALSSVNLTTLEQGDLSVTIGATGKVRPVQTATLAWATSGQVESVSVKTGEIVKAGQILATLSKTSLPQSVILAQSTLVSDQQALADLATTATQKRVAALADIATDEAAVKDAQYELDNFTVPVNQAKLSTTDALAKAKTDLDAARKAFEPYRGASESNSTREKLLEALNAAQADYNSAVKRMQYEYNLQVAQANLDQAWATFNKYKDGPAAEDIAAAEAKIASDQATLEQVYIKAPFNGTVTSVSALPGDQVSNGTTAFRMDNLTGLYVDLSVSEVDISQVQAGQPVSVTFDALANKVYTGQVTGVSQVSDASSSTTVNFTVNVHVTDADAAVLPGMTSEVKIIISQEKDALLVPLQAVTTLDGNSVVYVYQAAAGSQPAYTPIQVTLGTESDTYAMLASGSLKAGDQIVLNPDSLASALQASSSSQGGLGGIFGIFGGGGGGPMGGGGPGAGGPPPDGGGAPPAGAPQGSSGNSTQK